MSLCDEGYKFLGYKCPFNKTSTYTFKYKNMMLYFITVLYYFFLVLCCILHKNVN